MLSSMLSEILFSNSSLSKNAKFNSFFFICLRNTVHQSANVWNIIKQNRFDEISFKNNHLRKLTKVATPRAHICRSKSLCIRPRTPYGNRTSDSECGTRHWAQRIHSGRGTRCRSHFDCSAQWTRTGRCDEFAIKFCDSREKQISVSPGYRMQCVSSLLAKASLSSV